MTNDAVVVGAGPNGLAAAIELARGGCSVLVRERAETIGGGLRSEELTIPGFVHDVCSAIHPLAASSPFFRTLPLDEHGLKWIQPPLPVAHPLDDGSAVWLERSLDETAAQLGADRKPYLRLMRPLVEAWPQLEGALLGPLIRPPRHPLALLRFGLNALRSADGLARSVFETERARALFAGLAAHSILPLEQRATASFGLVLAAVGHRAGWPFPEGGSQKLADALASYLRTLGAEIATSAPVTSFDELRAARLVLCDLTTEPFLTIAGERLPERYRRRLERFQPGPGVFKLDWALSGPIPWAAEPCRRAGTVHVGGTLDEITAGERAPWRGEHAERPFVLLTQPSAFDPTRAPEGLQTAWAYCHVPNGSDTDMTDRIEQQIERFAPGFGDLVLARNAMGPAELERRNPNLTGGDITGGAQTLSQLLARPVLRLVPYKTPLEGVYLCSSSTPPGGGVHGMCGFLAARAALRHER